MSKMSDLSIRVVEQAHGLDFCPNGGVPTCAECAVVAGRLMGHPSSDFALRRQDAPNEDYIAKINPMTTKVYIAMIERIMNGDVLSEKTMAKAAMAECEGVGGTVGLMAFPMLTSYLSLLSQRAGCGGSITNLIAATVCTKCHMIDLPHRIRGGVCEACDREDS